MSHFIKNDRLLFGGEFEVKSSGAKIRGQLWLRGGSVQLWAEGNWYPLEVLGQRVRIIAELSELVGGSSEYCHGTPVFTHNYMGGCWWCPRCQSTWENEHDIE